MNKSQNTIYAFVLFCILVLTVILGVRSGSVFHPLNSPPINKVGKDEFDASKAGFAGVLLLAPGLSVDDLKREPTLVSLIENRAHVAVGLMPTRSGGDPQDLAAACQTLARGSRGATSGGSRAVSLGNVLQRNGVRVVLLDPASDNAAASPARSLVGDALPPPVSPATALRAPDAGAADGFVTNPAGVASKVRSLSLAAAPPHNAHLPPPPARFFVILFDDLHQADKYAPLALPHVTYEQRQNALRRLARLVALLTDGSKNAQGPPAAFVLLVAPLPSQDAQNRGERVAPVVLWRRDAHTNQVETAGDAMAPPRLLTSPSTRRTPGLLANTDIAATVAALLRLPDSERRIGAGREAQTVSRPLASGGSDGALGFLARRAAQWAAQGREQRLLVAVPWVLSALLLASRLCRARRPHLANAFYVAALTLPVALWLGAGVSLVVAGIPAYAGAGVVVALAVAASLRSPRLDTRRVLLVVAALTAAALWADTLAGGPLLARSPLSYSVQEAARFYGLGNEAEGVFLGASFVVAGALLSVSPLAALFWGGIVCAVFALPGLGADAGGFAAALVGFAALWSRYLARRFTWSPRQKTLAAAAAVLLVVLALAVFAIGDAKRGSSARSHTGEAVAAARERGPAALAEIAARKAQVGARLLVTSPWSLLLAAELTLLALDRRRAQSPNEPPNRAAAPLAVARQSDARVALYAAAAAALLLNDSGVVAASLCLLFVIPAQSANLS